MPREDGIKPNRVLQLKRLRRAICSEFMRKQTVHIFDPAMCCATGVCGPKVDPKLVQFAADLDWLKAEGIVVQRHNLSQSPAAFVENQLVRRALERKGEAALPLMIVNGKIAVRGRYPERKELAKLLKLKLARVAGSNEPSCCCGSDC